MMVDQYHEYPVLMTERQVSERYDIPVGTLRQMRVHGGGPTFIKIGRRVYYHASDVEAWLALQ